MTKEPKTKSENGIKKAAYIYGSRGPTFLSGWPFYFARALQAYGQKHNAFTVVDVGPKRARELPITFALWCLAWRTRRSSLFLLSRKYHSASVRSLSFSDSSRPYFIVCTQCVPERILNCRQSNPGARLIHYLDATLLDLFEGFDYALNPPAALKARMLREELSGYKMTDLFAVFHEGVRDRLVADYGVKASKIWVLGRGANLEPGSASLSRGTPGGTPGPKLRMMVVGKGARRKGVFKLVDAIDALEPDEQNKLLLSVAGPDPDELPERSYLRKLGFIRAGERARLVSEMHSSDIGVLLSEADSNPGSVWEFLSLGVPVWVTRLPYIESALEGCPVILENLPFEKASLVQRLRGFIHAPHANLPFVRQGDNLAARLSWTPQGVRLGQYIDDN